MDPEWCEGERMENDPLSPTNVSYGLANDGDFMEDKAELSNDEVSGDVATDGKDTPGAFALVTEEEAMGRLLDGDAKFEPRCVFNSKSWGTGTATIGNEILNLVKNIVGSGGLSLASGIAAYGNAPSAIIPALGLIVVMGVVNAYSFSLLGRVCSVTKARTYQEAWDRTVARRYGDRYNVFVSLVVVCKTLLGNWGFSIVIASTTQPLLQAAGWADVGRATSLIWVTTLVLLPLCIRERLSSLAGFSLVGQIGTLFTAFTMTYRYYDGSYREGGIYYDTIASEYQPSFASNGAWSFLTPQALILVSILSTGYVAHYNAPKYYYELVDHTTGRFNIVVNVSFIFAAVTYMAISSLGFLTFGENSAGFILDNYSSLDPLAGISRLGVALSMIFAYPLLFLGGRDGILDLLRVEDRSPPRLRLYSLVQLLCVTSLAIFLNDLTFVLSFSGATMSTAIIYIFPTIMFRSLVLNCSCLQTVVNCKEIQMAKAMTVAGAALGVLGAVMTIRETFF